MLGLVAIASAAVSHKSSFDADLSSIEVEFADVDFDETTEYYDLLLFTLNDFWSSEADLNAKPVTFSSSTGFHCDNSTGKNICIQFRKLKFDC